MWKCIAAALICAVLIAPAYARKERTKTAATVTNASTTMLAASQGPRVFLSISNESASATIACDVFGGTAAANTAGSYTFLPGVTRTWGPGDEEHPVPGGAVNCISSAATSPATIESAP